MKFQLIGVNHNRAPVEVRERLAIPESRLPEAMKTLVKHPGRQRRIDSFHLQSGGDTGANQKWLGADLRGFLRRILSESIRRIMNAPVRVPRERKPSAICSVSPPAWTRWWSANRRSSGR